MKVNILYIKDNKEDVELFDLGKIENTETVNSLINKRITVMLDTRIADLIVSTKIAEGEENEGH